jgi:hypothetical protein
VRCRLIKPFLLGQHVAQVAKRLDIVGLERHGPSDQVDRDVVAAHPAGQHTEKMEAIDVVGIDGTDLPVETLGLSQPASLVVRERQGEPLRKRRRRTGRLGRRRRSGGRLAPSFRRAPLLSVHGKELSPFVILQKSALSAFGTSAVLL